MPKGVHHTVSFAGGLVSPKVDARVDQAKYGSWLRQCENLIPYKTGALTRPPGTHFIAPAKKANTAGHNYAVKLQPFIFSPDTQFALEFGDGYIRFFSNNVQVTVNSAPAWTTATNYPAGSFVEDPGAANAIYYSAAGINGGTVQPHLDTTHWVHQIIYEVPSPYTADAGAFGSIYTTDVFVLKICQVNDVVYLVHPDYPPYSLTRFGDTDWVMKEVAFISPALLDQNVTDTMIAPSALVGAGITLTASAPSWTASTYYTLANSVEVTGVIYDCVVPNVSGSTFAADLALGYWTAVSIFRSGHIGSTWQLATLRQAAYVEYDGDAATGFTAGTSDQIQCLGAYEVHSYGVWSADIAIQRSLDGGVTWDSVQTVTGRSDRNVDLTGTAVQLGIYRLVISNVGVPVNPGATNPRVVFECVDGFIYGLVTITAVASATSATATVVTQLADPNPLQPQWVSNHSYTAADKVNYAFVNYTAAHNVMSTTPPPQDATNWTPDTPGSTEYWSEAAWSEYRGYPQAVTSFQQRMIYGASGFEPQRIWGTVTNDLQNFALGDQSLATDAFAFDLNAPSRGPIQWLIGQVDLFCGFSGAEWVINSGGGTSSASATTGGAITPTNISAAEQGTYGSAPYISPLIVGNACFFAQRQADALRQILFSVYTAKYMSTDMSLLADQLFSSGIVQMAYQGRWRHQGVVWVVTQQGSMAGLTYDLDQEVFGWCLRTTGQNQVDSDGLPITNDNGFESVATLFGAGNGSEFGDDQVWVVVNRLIGGVNTRYIEQVQPLNWEEYFTGAPVAPAPNLGAAYYVDCGLSTLTSGPSVLGLSHLIGRYVVGIVSTGIGSNVVTAFGPTLVNSGGGIALPASISGTTLPVQVGLPMPYFGQPMRFDLDPLAGNTQARIKQAADWYIRVYNSLGGYLSNGTSTYPTWVSGHLYKVGDYTVSPLTKQAYQCVVATSGTTDPSQDTAEWVQGILPSYQPPVAIPYNRAGNLPFGQPVLVTKPIDFRIPPQIQPVPDADPVIIVQGSDALPITVLGIFVKMDLISQP